MLSASQLKADGARLAVLLQELHTPQKPFTLTLTNGVCPGHLGTYEPGRQHITVHGGRGSFPFWLKVAIHEYAHHLHHTENALYAGDSHEHGATFQALNNALLALARNKGFFERSPIFRNTL